MKRRIAFLVALAACSDGATRLDPTALPDLAGLERPVADRIVERQAKAAQNPTAANFRAYARALHTHGMLEHAEAAYLAAIERGKPGETFPDRYLAAVAVSATDQARAVAMLETALAEHPGYIAGYLLRGRLLESLERFKAAEHCYIAALSRKRTVHALVGLSRVLLAQGNTDQALANLEHARERAPEHREVYEALARCHARLGNTEKSEAAARRVGTLDKPTPYHDELQLELGAENVSTEIRVHRAAALARGGQAAQAIREFQAVLAVRPDHVEAHDYMALLHENEQPRKALAHLDTILRKNPRYARALELRARILLRLNQRSRARQDLRTLLQVVPGHAWARQQLEK